MQIAERMQTEKIVIATDQAGCPTRQCSMNKRIVFCIPRERLPRKFSRNLHPHRAGIKLMEDMFSPFHRQIAIELGFPYACFEL